MDEMNNDRDKCTGCGEKTSYPVFVEDKVYCEPCGIELLPHCDKCDQPIMREHHVEEIFLHDREHPRWTIHSWCWRPVLWLTVYRVGDSYGGPEEGGWWFSTGEVIVNWPISPIDDIEQVKQDLMEIYGHLGNGIKVGSVLGGEEIRVSGPSLTPGKDYPEERPHYE